MGIFDKKPNLDKLIKKGRTTKIVKLLTEKPKNMENSEIKDFRLECLDALAKIKDPSTIEAIADAMQYQDFEFDKKALTTMKKIGGPYAIPQIGKKLQDTNQATRKFAAQLLGEMKNPGATEFLVDSIIDPNPGVQKAVFEALRKIGDNKAIVALKRFLEDKNENFRSEIKRTIEAIQSKS